VTLSTGRAAGLSAGRSPAPFDRSEGAPSGRGAWPLFVGSGDMIIVISLPSN
jgi:hypothetical protein